MKSMLAFLLLFLSSSAFAALHAQPNDIKKFESTGTCPSCDLSGSILMCDARNVSFNLANSNLIRSGLEVTDEGHQNSNMTNLVAIELEATYGDFSGSNFSNSNLRNAKLAGSNFSHVDFSGANVAGANLNDANLFGAKLSPEQLASLGSVCNAILPDGSTGKCK